MLTPSWCYFARALVYRVLVCAIVLAQILVSSQPVGAASVPSGNETTLVDMESGVAQEAPPVDVPTVFHDPTPEAPPVMLPVEEPLDAAPPALFEVASAGTLHVGESVELYAVVEAPLIASTELLTDGIPSGVTESNAGEVVEGLQLTMTLPSELVLLQGGTTAHLPPLTPGVPFTVTWTLGTLSGNAVAGALPIEFALLHASAHPSRSTFWLGVANGSVQSASGDAIAAAQEATGAALEGLNGAVGVFASAGAAPQGTQFRMKMLYGAEESSPTPDADSLPTGWDVVRQFLPSVLGNLLPGGSVQDATTAPEPPSNGTIPSLPTPEPTLAPAPEPTVEPTPEEPISNDARSFPDADLPTLEDANVNLFALWELDAQLTPEAAAVRAADLDDEGNLHNLDGSVLLRVDVAPLIAAGIDPASLRIWTREQSGDVWEALPSSRYNHLMQVVEAWTDHFSQFGLGQGLDASGDSLPNVKAFSADILNGGGAASIAIETPKGNGGMSPNLSLSYSSVSIDDLMREAGDFIVESQASSAGIGWHLDGISYIARVDGTRDPNGILDEGLPMKDRTYALVLNGQRVSMRFIDRDGTANDTWRTNPEIFAHIYRGSQQVGNLSDEADWYVITADGTTYEFGDYSPTAGYSATSANASNIQNSTSGNEYRQVNRWYLRKVIDTSGNTMAYEYRNERQDEYACMQESTKNSGNNWYTSAVDPTIISWSGNPAAGTNRLMRVVFGYSASERGDIKVVGSKNNDCLQTWFGKYNQLTTISVQVYADGAWRTQRSYTLGQLLKNYTLSGQETQYRILLSSITEKGDADGTLRIHQFGYADPAANYVLLTSASNGWGGSVAYGYIANRVSCSTTTCPNGMLRRAINTLTTSDGLGNSSRIAYYYGPPNSPNGEWGAVANDGGFLGYKQAELTYLDTDISTVLKHETYYSYNQGDAASRENPDPRQGKIKSLEVRTAATGTLLSTTQYDWKAYWYLSSGWDLVNSRSVTWNTANGQYPPTWIRLNSTATTIGASVTIQHNLYSSATEVNTQFGNVVSVLDDNDFNTANYLRRTDFAYFPNTAVDTVNGYIVNLPARTVVLNALGTCVSETRNVYGKGQQNSNYLTPPTTAHLVKTEQLLTGNCSATATIPTYDANWAITHHHYDAWGNQILVKRLGANSSYDIWFETLYDSVYRLFPIEQFYTANPGYKEKARYYGVNGAVSTATNAAWGQIQDWCGVNNVCTWQGYDEFGRKIARWSNRTGQMTGTPAITSAESRWYYYAPLTFGTAHKAFVVVSWDLPRCAGNLTRSHYNGLGQLVATQTSYADWLEPGSDGSCTGSSGGQEIHTYYRYDGLGRQRFASIPVLATRSAWTSVPPTVWPGGTTTTYNALDRVATSTAPNGIPTQNYYSDIAEGSQVATVLEPSDAPNDRMLSWTQDNLLGQRIQLRTYNRSGASWTLEASVNLANDMLGNVTVVDPPGTVANTTITYDKGSRKIAMSDPDLGNWSYAYDRQGRLIRQVDARNKVTCLYYDAFERLVAKDFYDAGAACPAAPKSPVVDGERFGYGGVANTGAYGQLTATARYTGGALEVSRAYSYDARGYMIGESVWVTGLTTQSVSYGYDEMGRRNSITYADGEKVTTSYNGMGLPARLVSTLGGVTTVLVQGTMQGATANGAAYDAFGRLTQMNMHGSTTWRTLEYYAPTGAGVNSGRLRTIKVGTTAAAANLLSLAHEWDASGNLTRVIDAGVSIYNTYDHQSRVLSGLGRSFTWRNDGGFATFEGKGVTYPTTDHGMTAIDGGGAFAYDANGNMTSRRIASGAATQTLTWTKDNLLQSVAIAGSTTESYLYDNTGQRVKKSSGTLSTYYLFPELEIIRNGSTEIESKYYFFGGQRVATRNNDGSFVYLHSDHLGSVVAETLGTTAHPERYHAYGSTRSSTTLPYQDYKFTGQLSDGTGLVYMNARYYDPAIGQFISPDTIVPNPDNLQDYNRYMYARGNPLKYNDPSGHCTEGYGDEDFECFYLAQQIYRQFSYGPEDWSVLAGSSIESLRETYAELSAQAQAGPQRSLISKAIDATGAYLSKPIDAVVIGAGGGLDVPLLGPAGVGMGLSAEVVIDRDLEWRAFVTGSFGPTVGAGGNGRVYGGVVRNLPTVEEYAGPMVDGSITLSYGWVGATLGHEVSLGPTPTDVTYIGWAPGADVSLTVAPSMSWQVGRYGR